MSSNETKAGGAGRVAWREKIGWAAFLALAAAFWIGVAAGAAAFLIR